MIEMKKTIQTLFLIIVATAFLTACVATPTVVAPGVATTQAPTTAIEPATAAPVTASGLSLQDIYTKVYESANPSVVNIQVIQKASTTSTQGLDIPGFPQFQNPQNTP